MTDDRDARRRGLRLIGARLLVVAAAAGATFGAVECAFRLFAGEEPRYRRQAQRVAQEEPKRGAAARPDAPPAEVPAADGGGRTVTRVLFLGDSFTRGSGLKDRNRRFTHLLAQRLSSPAASQPAVELFNAAVGGSSPVDWEGYLDRAKSRFEPDVVVAVFFLRDGTALSTSYRFNLERLQRIEDEESSAFVRSLAEHSVAVRWFRARRAEQRLSGQLVEEIRRAYLGSAEETAVWVRQQQALIELRDRCPPGTRFALVIFPMLASLGDYPFFEVEDEIVRFAARHRIDVFSLTGGFLGRDERRLWVAPDDQHPNEVAHRIAADTLEPFLRRLIERPERGSAPARHSAERTRSSD